MPSKLYTTAETRSMCAKRWKNRERRKPSFPKKVFRGCYTYCVFNSLFILSLVALCVHNVCPLYMLEPTLQIWQSYTSHVVIDPSLLVICMLCTACACLTMLMPCTIICQLDRYHYDDKACYYMFSSLVCFKRHSRKLSCFQWLKMDVVVQRVAHFLPCSWLKTSVS